MQSSRDPRWCARRSGTRENCAALAEALAGWLLREVDDFERLTPLQSDVLDTWNELALEAERVDELEKFDPRTAGAAPIRDTAAVSVVVEARAGLTPQASVAPATGWSSPSFPPARGWATHPEPPQLSATHVVEQKSLGEPS